MSKQVYCLADANSFFATCHKVFRPDLRNRPVVVLSANDGNIIARSAEAKPFVKMGEPYFKAKDAILRHGITVFSSNFVLYGDMSERFMRVIENEFDSAERYSCDELFFHANGFTPTQLEDTCRALQTRVVQYTGIAIGVGAAPTKTLAKLANYAAKKWLKQTGGYVDLCDPIKREKLMRVTPVGEVWGVGQRMQEQLTAMGITTALQLSQADTTVMRKRFSVVIERLCRELRGTPCLDLEIEPKDKQEICSSKSFGSKLTDLAEIQEAAAAYATTATNRMRAQQLMCERMMVSLRTSKFSGDGNQFYDSRHIQLPYASDDTRMIASAAAQAIASMYVPGFAYSKCDVMLTDLRRRGSFTGDIFAGTQPVKSDTLMQTMDAINSRFGRDALKPARIAKAKSWGQKQEFTSPCYTTRLDELWQVHCR